MDDNEENRSQNGDNPSKDVVDEAIEQALRDPAKKARLLQRLGIGDSDENEESTGNNTSVQRDGRTTTGLGAGYPDLFRSTLSGKSMSGTQQSAMFPPGSHFFPNPYFLYGPYCPPPMGGGLLNPTSGPARSRRKRPRIVEEPDEEEESQSQDQEEDRVELLSEGEALEFIEFDPTVDPKDSWKAPSTMTSFLEKHFNRSLSDDEREAIMKDFPRLHCDALTTPKIDDDLKEQLKSRGKDPHFGAEKSLYKIQDQLMDVAGPLTCLWADLLNKEAETSPEDVLLLIQRVFIACGKHLPCH